MIYDDIVQTIGRTPTIRIRRLAPPGIEMFVKLESRNPGGSVKDRLALGIILDAERRGALVPGQTVIESTSGNTGIALAMICASRGYPFVAVMSDSFSVERRLIMRAYGARVILTPAAERATGMLRRARELAEQNGWFLAHQFENPANPAYHRQTTGPEILSDFANRRLDVFVTGWGTGGTLTGAGRMLRTARPDIRVVAAEPANAQLLGGGEYQPHKIQGWTPNLVPAVLDRDVFTDRVAVTEQEAIDTARALAAQEGLFVGISSGGTFAAALQIARDAAPGTAILAMLPDTGERYLSTVLFEGMNTGSD